MNNGHPDIDSSDKMAEAAERRRFTLRKGEKLRHRSLVEPLFREGKTLYEFPLRLTWRTLTTEELEQSFRNSVPEQIDSVQMLITVPKKKRRRAVDRVLMRRRIREAYRLNRLSLKQQLDADNDVRTLGMAIIYLHDKNLPYATIEAKMRILLNRVAQKLKAGQNK